MADDENEEGNLSRFDSMMYSPAMMKGEEGPFPAVSDVNQHAPPLNRALFDTPPKKDKYYQLISALMKQKDYNDLLTKDMMTTLCADTMEAMRDEPSLLDIQLAKTDCLVVVGDVHGQFADLITHILSHQYDRPSGSPSRKFLFLGDYVDRGPQGVEVIALLFALKVEYPTSVFLLRGNHEESQTSRVYGFLYEVRTKFNDLSVWARCNEVFCFIPLGALVTVGEHRFVALHGGLSPGLQMLSSIAAIERFDYGGTLDNASSDIVDGMLWSDPSDLSSRFNRNERGCGYTFGAAVTSEFCAQNQLDFICRAHQMTLPGYCWTHDGKCLTVFSAPNYCGLSNNLGAVMIVDGAWHLEFVQYQSAPSSPHGTASSALSYFQ